MSRSPFRLRLREFEVAALRVDSVGEAVSFGDLVRHGAHFGVLAEEPPTARNRRERAEHKDAKLKERS